MSNFLNRLVCAAAVVVLVAASTSVATVLMTPNSAFAKNDKSHGAGKGHSKSEKGHSKSGKHGKSGKLKADNRRGQEKTAKKGYRKSHKKYGQKHDKYGEKKYKKYSSIQKHKKYSWSGRHKKHNTFQKKRSFGQHGSRNQKHGYPAVTRFGQEFGRDVRRLFGSERKTTKKRNRRYKSQTIAPISRSPRPKSRDYARGDRYDYARGNRDRVRNDARFSEYVSRRDADPKLRGLNAAHANSKALQNAAPNSQVGRIATYKDSAEKFYDLRDDVRTKVIELKKLDAGYDGRSSRKIVDDIAALDPNDPNYDDALGGLTDEFRSARSYEVEREGITDDIQEAKSEIPDAAREARAAFLSASNGRVISPEAKAELHHLLGLPEPVTPRGKRVTREPHNSVDASAAFAPQD